MGKSLTPQEQEEFILHLREFIDVFAWSHKDMSRIDWDIAKPKILLYPDAKSVKQKVGRMKPKWALKIKEDI